MDRLRCLAEVNGFFTRAEAMEVGFDDKTIRRMVKGKTWTRIRNGAYTYSDLWVVADEVRRHRVTAHAVVTRLGNNVALSHTSAALEHGMTDWGADLSLVHVTRLDGGAGRTEAGVVHHEGFCLDEDVLERDGMLLMKPARAALESGSLRSTEAAVALFDDGLHKQIFDEAELDASFALMNYWPGKQNLQVAVRFADGRAESIGESRSRRMFGVQGLPAPALQYPVYDGRGRLIGTTDFAWPEYRLLGEFDGKVKYGRLLKPGEDPGDAVFREKVREDLLREATGWRVIRIVWRDLYHPAGTAARIRRLMLVAA